MRKRFGRLGVVTWSLLTFSAVLVIAGCAQTAATLAAAPPPAPAIPAAAISVPVSGTPQSPADIARGKALFTGTCGAYCHRGSTAPATVNASDAPSLFDCDWRHGGSDAQIFNSISKGVEGTRMVAFGGALPDEDIWRIVAYLKSASLCNPPG
jgi:high-affinity iron transporter